MGGYEFVFRNGKFSHGDLLGLEKEAGVMNIVKAIREQGFVRSQTVGEELALSYQLWEHDERGWVVLFSTPCRCTVTLVEDWPDLVELLHKLSTIALAIVLRDEDDDGNKCTLYMPVMPTKPLPARKKST